MLLVTCANGKTGKSIILELEKRKIDYAALVKSNDSFNSLKKLGVKNIIVSDLSNLEDLKKKLKLISSIYFISPNFSNNDSLFLSNIISILKEKEKKKLIFHSVIHPQVKKLPHHWSKLQLEKKIINLNFPWVIIQPTMYMQNILGQSDLIKKTNELIMPIPLKRKLMMVDLSDVAEVAVDACFKKSFDYGIFELSSDYLNIEEQANILSKVLNLKITAVSISISDSMKKLQIPFSGNYGKSTYRKMFNYYSNYGLRGNSKILKMLLGRKPTTFFDFAEKTFK